MPGTLRNPWSTSYSRPGGLPPGVKWLLIINCGIFVLTYFTTARGYGFAFNDFGLWPRAVITLPAVWQLVTYMFLHDPRGFSHILWNMLTLWLIGSDLERDWGTKYFLKFYFTCGVGAGLCVVLANVLFGSLDTRTIGSSGALFGLLLAYGILYSERILLFGFLFPIKAKYFVMILGAISLLGSFGPSGGGVSYIAHLGGMLIGFLYLKKRGLGRSWVEPLRRQYRSWKHQRAKKKFEVYRRRRESDRPDRWVN
ncbi:MAG TPA: rhomboid family intramembrane serine protease [Bryobacteraceae bacterium]|nr:rhomboid family intramembrane serine protease [Bryobacteraceae bacterium]